MERIAVDICIVGSGPAGALVAGALAGRGKRIAIVEAGAAADDAARRRQLAEGDAGLAALDRPHLHVPLRFDTPTNRTHWQVQKVGGNSRIWGGMTPRGLEGQFQMRSQYGVGEDWPIDYDELEPYYCEAEAELGVAGDATTPRRSQPYPLPPIVRDPAGELFARACAALGYSCETTSVAKATRPYRGREACRDCNLVKCVACATTARYKSDVHLQQALADRGVTLFTETRATKLVTGSSGRIDELVCYLPDRAQRIITAGTFIVAGNAVGSARLLLLSGVANRSDAVGRYLMGHPVYEMWGQLAHPVMAGLHAFTTVCRHFETGPHLRTGAAFRMFVNGADLPPTLHGLRLVKQGSYGRDFKQALVRLATHGIKATVITDMLPSPDNRVELDPTTTDHDGQPGLRIAYRYAEYDDIGRRLGVETMAGVLAQLGATPTRELGYDLAHQMGTTRMGLDPKTSVVNRDLRAHDVENLYIVGTSVFPNALGPTNPTLTLAALALRLGAHLRRSGC